jgi:hypothetical protein
MVYVAPTMVSAIANPALDAFVAEIRSELLFGELLVRAKEDAYELIHAADRNIARLRDVSLIELRQLAQFTSGKQFRPLKSAPTLQGGWRFTASNSSELGAALQMLYPGAVADWFAARQPNPPVTDYRSYTSRQTGMYRVTAMLNDGQAAAVTRAGCHRRFCLKRRLWTTEGLSPDTEGKSLIPCLEPCAVLLEFARTVARIEQRPPRVLALAVEDIEAVTAALEQALEGPATVREADFSAVGNPRRLQLLLEKLEPALALTNQHENS